MTTRLLDALAPQLRDAVIAIGRDARNALGRPRPIQDLFLRHADTLDALADEKITRAEIARLLVEVGVARPDGRPLPETTISSARVRARARLPAAGRRADANGRNATQDDNAERNTTHKDANRHDSTKNDRSRRDATRPDTPGPAPTAEAAGGSTPAPAARPPPPSASCTAADLQRAADLLIELQDRT